MTLSTVKTRLEQLEEPSPHPDKPQEGMEARRRHVSTSDGRAGCRASPLRRSLGVCAARPDSPQAKASKSRWSGITAPLMAEESE